MFQRNIFSIAVALMILSMVLYFLYPASKNSSVRENDIEGADFFWTDAGGKSYNVKADYVIETQAGGYKLIVVKGKYYLDAGRKNYVDLSSDTALFNEGKNSMELKGNVEFRSSEGYKATSDSMFLDLTQKTAHTGDKVTLTGMQGNTVSQKGMTMYMGMKKILLYGPISSIFTSTNSQPPIKVEARTVEADYGSQVITYHDKVVVHQANAFDLYCDRAMIFYAKNERSKYTQSISKSLAGSQAVKAKDCRADQSRLARTCTLEYVTETESRKLTNQEFERRRVYVIKQIEFFGKVMVVKGEKIAAGDFGVLDPQNKVMILRGNVALKEKDAYLEGEEVHYNTGNGIFTVHKAKQLKQGSGKQERIRVILGSEPDDNSKRN